MWGCLAGVGKPRMSSIVLIISSVDFLICMLSADPYSLSCRMCRMNLA